MFLFFLELRFSFISILVPPPGVAGQIQFGAGGLRNPIYFTTSNFIIKDYPIVQGLNVDLAVSFLKYDFETQHIVIEGRGAGIVPFERHGTADQF